MKIKNDTTGTAAQHIHDVFYDFPSTNYQRPHKKIQLL